MISSISKKSVIDFTKKSIPEEMLAHKKDDYKNCIQHK